MEILIREAIVADAPAIAMLCTESLGYPTASAAVEIRLINLIRNREVVYVAEENGAVLGFIHAEKYQTLYYNDMVNILGLAVFPDCRNRGIGKQLMQGVQNWAKQQGITEIRLNSGISRERAHIFYEHIGFTDVKLQKRFIKKILETQE